ncbi:MAG: hypothetical protein ABI983_09945, partial [Acidobacteriota bacterium]
SNPHRQTLNDVRIIFTAQYDACRILLSVCNSSPTLTCPAPAMNEQHDSQAPCPFCPQAVGFVRAVCIEGQTKIMTFVCIACNSRWKVSEPCRDSLGGIESTRRVERDEPMKDSVRSTGNRPSHRRVINPND